MKIGERIKSLRMQKMMTQNELAGAQITRNMLSCIENGTALPSLPTMIYLAGRLGVPAGLLVADEGDEFAFHKMNRMPDIKQAFDAGDWAICRDLCLSLGGSDDEIAYLICLCDFNAAKDAFSAGDLHEACELFDRALTQTRSTSYPLGFVPAVGGAYIAYMREISPTFDSDAGFSDTVLPDALGDPFCRYYFALKAFRSEGQSLIDCQDYISLCAETDGAYVTHIRAKELMRKKKYYDACTVLKSLLNDSVVIPAPMLYFVFADLEVCCSELSDYKGAYDYSRDKVAMLERFFR